VAEILNVVRARQGATVPGIQRAIDERRSTDDAYTTVPTLVQRLFARDLPTREPAGRTFRHRATQSREKLPASWCDEIIDRRVGASGSIAIAPPDGRLRSLRERRAPASAARRPT
jgi:predicted transcriptional regulator